MSKSKKLLQLIVLSCAILVFIANPICGQNSFETIIIDTLKDEYRFNDHLYFFEDQDCQYKVEDLIDNGALFKAYTPEELDKSSYCYWLRFNLQAAPEFNHYFKNWKLFIGEADFASIYVFDDNARLLESKQSGSWYPISKKDEKIEYKLQRVNLSFDLSEKKHFFIRYQRKDHHDHVIDIQLKRQDFFQSLDYLYDSRQNWLFLGFVLTMFLINLIFFLGTRFVAFLFHGLFIAGISIFTLDFFGITDNLYFIRDHPYLVQLVDVAGVAMADVAYFLFIRYYLSLSSLMPRWDKILFSLIILKLIFWPLIIIYYYLSYNEPLTDMLILVFLVTQYIVIAIFLFYLFRNKQRKSIWIVVGSAFIFLLIIINMISLINNTGISSAFTQIGVGGEILCFTLGLAFRFNDLRKEKAEAIRIKELSKFKSQLLTNITHEFRTPLTIIQGVADLIKDSMSDKNSKIDLKQASNALDRNSSSLLSLVNQMLDLAKLENNKMTLDLEVVDLVALVNEVYLSFQSAASKKKISLSYSSSEKKLLVNSDKEKMHVILSNLISNALKFTPEGGSVVLGLDKIDTSVKLNVTDSGLGIPSAEQAHVFDRFYQVNQVQNEADGTGIGLSLVKEFVDLLGGEISIDSEENRGSSFTVILPLREDIVSLVREVEENIPAEIDSGGNSVLIDQKPILLIVEDNEDVLNYLEVLLAKDYILKMARDGLEGLSLANQIIPDLIISDLMMPKLDGIRLCKALKENEKTNHIPIVILTAKADFEHRIEGLETGADAYLTKPFRKEELYVRLRKLNASRLALQKKYSQFSLLDEPKDLKKENSFVHKVNSIIEENLINDQFGVESLASNLHMSRMQLHRKLTAVSSRSASNYIRSFRLYKSKPLFLDKNKTISEIAWEVGFQDANYFSKSFQKEFDSTPSEYRRLLESSYQA